MDGGHDWGIRREIRCLTNKPLTARHAIRSFCRRPSGPRTAVTTAEGWSHRSRLPVLHLFLSVSLTLHAHVHARVRTRAPTHTHTHTHTSTQPHTYTHAHTHTHRGRQARTHICTHNAHIRTHADNTRRRPHRH